MGRPSEWWSGAWQGSAQADSWSKGYRRRESEKNHGRKGRYESVDNPYHLVGFGMLAFGGNGDIAERLLVPEVLEGRHHVRLERQMLFGIVQPDTRFWTYLEIVPAQTKLLIISRHLLGFLKLDETCWKTNNAWDRSVMNKIENLKFQRFNNRAKHFEILREHHCD